MSEVRRIRTEGGTHIEPPLDPSWSNLDKLRWHVAVVKLECDLDIQVFESCGLYSFMVNGLNSPHLAYQHAWYYLLGVEIGDQAQRVERR